MDRPWTAAGPLAGLGGTLHRTAAARADQRLRPTRKTECAAKQFLDPADGARRTILRFYRLPLATFPENF